MRRAFVPRLNDRAIREVRCAWANGQTTGGSRSLRRRSDQRGHEYRCRGTPIRHVRRRCSRWWNWWRRPLQVPSQRGWWLGWTYSLARARDDCRCRLTEASTRSPQPFVIPENGRVSNRLPWDHWHARRILKRLLTGRGRARVPPRIFLSRSPHETCFSSCFFALLLRPEHDFGGRRGNVAVQRFSQRQSESEIRFCSHPAMAGSRPAFFRAVQ